MPPTEHPGPENRLEWRGREVAWDRFGDGPPLMLLHGTPWSSALWRPIAELLAERWSVHVYDMPGYGASSKLPEHPVGLRLQGELLAELLGLWGLESPHVVAHDIGGAVALRARLLHGVSFASLTLVDPVALRPWGSPFFRLVQEHEAVLAQLPDAVHRGAVEGYIGTASARGLEPEALAMLVESWLGTGKEAFYRQIAEADEHDTDELDGHWSELTEPVHLIWGAEDTWIPVDRLERLRTRIPHATSTVLEGAGHLVQLDAPEALHAAIADGLAAATSGSAR